MFPGLYAPGPKWVRPKRPLNVFKNVPLYSKMLNEFNLNLTAEFSGLNVYRALSVNDIRAKLNVNNGALEARASAVFAGGGVDAVALARDVGGVLSARAAGIGRGVRVGGIMDGIRESGYVSELPVDFEFYLEGAGANLSDLVASAWGPVRAYSTGRGYVYSELVGYLYGQDFLTSLRHSLTDMFRSEDKYDQMAVECAAANLKIRGGRIDTERGVAVATNAINIRAKGYVDFGAETMKAALATVPVRGLKLSVTGSIVNSMEISGNLAEPDFRVSGSAIAAKAITATGIGLLLAPFTGGLSIVAGAGVGLLAGDLLENWLSDSHPCRTALESGAPPESGDPEFLNLAPEQLAREMIGG
jgi:hypothetical protein